MRGVVEHFMLLFRADPGNLRPHEREDLVTRDNASENRTVAMLAFPLVAWLAWKASAPGTGTTFLPALGSVILMNVLGWTVPWRRVPRWVESIPPVASMVGLWFMAVASGGAAGIYAGMILVPIIWISLYGDPIDVLVTAVLAVACIVAPVRDWIPSLPDQGTAGDRILLTILALTFLISARPLVIHLRDQARSSRRATYSLRASQAALAHDLRTPLTSVCALASLAEQRLQSDDPGSVEAAREYVERISQLGWRAETTIRGVLDLSRAGELLPGVEDIDVRALLVETADDIDGVRVELGALPATIRGHEPSIRRLFANLLENAALHGHDREPGAVAHVTVTGAATTGGWQFRVVDDGPGIADAERELVFRPWQRGVGARDGGHGLGLALVSAIVEQHGGSIAVEPTPPGERGARIVFSLERSPRVATAADELEAQRATGLPAS